MMDMVVHTELGQTGENRKVPRKNNQLINRSKEYQNSPNIQQEMAAFEMKNIL